MTMLRLIIRAALLKCCLLPLVVSAGQPYCRYSDKGTILLIDQTTQYDEIDRKMLKSGLNKIYGDLGPGDRLAVYLITDDFTNAPNIFDECYPGCPDANAIFAWLWGDCSAAVARKNRLAFEARLATKLNEVIQSGKSFKRSDIIQTVVAVSRTHKSDQMSRLIVFSDLLENSAFLPWPTILIRDPEYLMGFLAAKELLPSVSGKTVQVFGFGRGHSKDRRGLLLEDRNRLESFWLQFFIQGGAEGASIGQRY